jgi:hypothetical protein
MFLLSPETIKIFKICLNFASFFRVIPYEWDRNRNCFALIIKKLGIRGRIVSWDVVKYLTFVHLIFVLVRLWQSISARRHDFAFYIMLSTYVLIFVLASLVQLLMIEKKVEILVFVNRFLQFAQYIERKSRWSETIGFYVETSK